MTPRSARCEEAPHSGSRAAAGRCGSRRALPPEDPHTVAVRELGDERAVAAALADGFGGTPTLALVDEPHGDLARALLRAGARGVLPRGASRADLDAAAAAVLRGFLVLAAAPDPPAGAAPERLTPRERDVLEELARGAGNKAIAQRLGLSEHTIKFHVASILAKLGAATRTEAVTIGVRRGFVML